MSSTSRTLEHPELGTIHIRKIRGSKHLRLRIRPDGSVQLTLPFYVSLKSGLEYLHKQSAWVMQNRFEKPRYKTGDKIGRAWTFAFIPFDSDTIQSRRGKTNLFIKYPRNLTVSDPAVQEAAHKLAHRALKHEAEELLPDWLEGAAKEFGFRYRSCKIRQLRSRWGSCSSEGDITLNIFLTQLPDELIEYVLLHELNHTKHLNHSPEFWAALEEILPNAKVLRRQIRNHRPSL